MSETIYFLYTSSSISIASPSAYPMHLKLLVSKQ